jgi:hypothetical protein
MEGWLENRVARWQRVVRWQVDSGSVAKIHFDDGRMATAIMPS